MADPPVRLLNFISEQELAQIREKRSERGEVETTVPDKPLYEILKENKDKQQAEFNERFKHRPPKALDEDETEFLEKLETYQKGRERDIAKEEAQQLLNFQAAVASSMIKSENFSNSFQQSKEVKAIPKGKRPTPSKPLINLVKIKPQPKKAKVDEGSELGPLGINKTIQTDQGVVEEQERNTSQVQGLVSYATDSDESDD